jgi:hypothetical protein
MLPNEKNDLLYLLNILEYIGKIMNIQMLNGKKLKILEIE